MTVGLAIIARDEADTLPGLLESVAGSFDQVILCDTGSTDGTVDVFERWARAQQWPGHGFAPWKVGRFAWRDDFAAARNHADSLLDTEWSSWADCDDVVRGAESLRGLAAAAPPDLGAFAAGYDYARLTHGATIAYVRRERLVRRSRSLGWVHRVHEHQRFAGAGVDVGPEVCEWVHRKWTLAPGEGFPVSDRNLEILRSWVADEPDHPHALSCLAQELQLHGAHREAVRWYHRYLRGDDPERGVDHRVRTLRLLAISHLLLGQRRRALRAARAASELLPDGPDACLARAEAHLALHHWARAERWARRTLAAGQPDTELTINPLDYSFAPRLALAGALAGMRRFGEAVAVGDEARELVPSHAELERQLEAWRRRELARPRRVARAPQVAAAAAMVAGLLGTPVGAGAQPQGVHNELAATVAFNGIPILPPSTTGVTRVFRITALGGGHQLKGSQYVPFVAGFDPNLRLVTNNVIGGFGRANSDVTAIFPFDSTNLLGIDQTDTGRIGAFTRLGQTDPQCNSGLGPQRPLSFDRGYLSPFLGVGALPPTDTGFFLDLFNPSTCRVIASVSGQFDPNRATDVRTFVFGPNGVLVGGAAGAGSSEDPAWKFVSSADVRIPWIAPGAQLSPNLPLVEFPLPGSFTGGVSLGSNGFDLVGFDPTRAVFFGACGGPTGQPDPRCGPNGSRILLDLDPSIFQVFSPQIATGPGGTIISLPYQNLQDGTPHATFLRVDPNTLGVQAQRDVLFPGTTHIPGISVDPRGNVLFGVTIRNPLDPSDPLDNNRVGLGLLNPDLSLNRLTINQTAPTPPVIGPAPRVNLLPFLEQQFVAQTFPGGARAQAQAAAVSPRRIVRVQFAAVRVSGHGASLRCAWLRDRRAHFVADTPIRGSCQGARWVTAAKGRANTWTLRLTRRLPRGRYVGYARATNAAGVTVRRFGPANKRAFNVR